MSFFQSNNLNLIWFPAENNIFFLFFFVSGKYLEHFLQPQNQYVRHIQI